jgi:LAS superfamily LD-carboxypeptidase LdcB
MILGVLILSSCSGASTKDFEYKSDIREVEKVLNTKDKKFLELVNKKHTVDSDYKPDDLVEVDTKYTTQGKEIILQKDAAAAAEALVKEMRACGIKNVSITSGYRSYQRQKVLFEGYCAEEKIKHPTWSDSKIEEYVLTYSAEPGKSEHHTGLCVDLITTEMLDLVNYGSETDYSDDDKGFAETEAFEWLRDNAHKFGFILRYPEDKTKITGYSYESWHYRFVGVAAATEMYEKEITLEEYLGK